MSTQEDVRWLKYLATCGSRTATPDERRVMFDLWWKPIKDECLATPVDRKNKRKQAKAAHA